MRVEVLVGIWRGHRKGETPIVPDDALTREGLAQEHVVEVDAETVTLQVAEEAEPVEVVAEQPEPEPEPEPAPEPPKARPRTRKRGGST